MSDLGSTAFADHVMKVRAELDSRLALSVADAVRGAETLGPAAHAMVEAAGALTMRGGKRVRSALVRAAFEGCGGPTSGSPTLMAEVAFEWLQTYLLIHDDWMDADEVRRGGPSVHVMLRDRFGEAADAGGILAGDYACAQAQAALLEVPLSASRIVEAARAFAKIQLDVVMGQTLDLVPTASVPVERVHTLKTATYTVTGPLEIGAILAGASREVREGLARFGTPLGIAFQLRDDLLSLFGDPKTTGKPLWSDIRQGKHTALIAEVADDPEAQRLLPEVLGVRLASDERIATLVSRIEITGARARVEARVAELLRTAREELAHVDVLPEGKTILWGAIVALGERAS